MPRRKDSQLLMNTGRDCLRRGHLLPKYPRNDLMNPASRNLLTCWMITTFGMQSKEYSYCMISLSS